ncbi:MAG: CoA transferase [Alphaproteobacteria bacterium]|nr:CoA transferase [Alphaproteobacteria bacterium]
MKLAGVRVLDLSQFLPGPHLTMTMADHGADVIMVEPPSGEPVRQMGARTQDGVTVWFRNIARGKRSVTLDLKSDAGRDAFLTLADEADVIVEAFRPGVVKRLGVDYETVAARNPRIVYCALTAFGQTGPYRDKPAHDLVVQALAGTADLARGRDDDKPAMPNLVAADMAASLTALSAIAMALFAREKSGRGDYLDVAMYDALLAWTPNITASVFAEDRAPQPKAMRNYGGQAMNRLYETKDGRFLALGGSEAKFAAALLGALGRPDLAPLAAGEPGATQQPLIDFLTQCFAAKTLAEWQKLLEPLALCWAPLRTLKEAFDDPHTQARRMLLRDAAGFRHIGAAAKFAQEPAQPRLHLPDAALVGAPVEAPAPAIPAWKPRA